MKHSFFTVAALAAVLSANVHAADDLASRLAAVEDRLAIEQLVLGDYPRALDELRFNDYAALFTTDGELIIPGFDTLKGPKAISKFLSTPGVFDPPPAPGSPKRAPAVPKPYQLPHITSNPSYKVTGNSATGGAYWTEVTLVDGKTQVTLSGHYLDELKKVNGQWKFAKRTVVPDVQAP